MKKALFIGLLIASIAILLVLILKAFIKRDIMANGKLLIAMSNELNKNIGIHSIDIANKKVDEIFESSEYDILGFVSETEGKIYCVAKKLNNNSYVVLVIDDGNIAKEVYESDRKIYHPCFWQVSNRAVRNLIFRAPHSHYWDFMVECVSL